MPPKRQKAERTDPGTFMPQAPGDSQEVIELFAVAARAACAKPDGIEEITKRLGLATSDLVAPESIAARECAQLWEVFIRVAARPKPSLRNEAGKALARDLDAIGRRLDLPPLNSWDDIPEFLEARNPIPLDAESTYDKGESLEWIKKKAQEKKRKRGKGPAMKAKDVLNLIKQVSPRTRENMLKIAVGDGALGRTDATLLIQALAMDSKVAPGQDLLRDNLEKLGAWLVKSK